MLKQIRKNSGRTSVSKHAQFNLFMSAKMIKKTVASNDNKELGEKRRDV